MLYSQKRPVHPRIYPPFQQLMRPSQNLPLPPRIHLPFQKLYATLPFNNYMRHSRIYPYLPEYTLIQQLYATLPESTPTSQNTPPFSTTDATLPESTPTSRNTPTFSTTICDPLRIYPFFPEYSPLFNNYLWYSQKRPLPPRIYPIFQQLYATLPESTPTSQNKPPNRPPPHFQQLYATLPESTPTSQNAPPPPFNNYICDPPRIYPYLPEYTPLPSTTICDPPRSYPYLLITPFLTTIMRPSQKLPLPPRIYPTFSNIILCDAPRIYPSLPEYTPHPFLNNYMRPSQNLSLPLRIYPRFQQLYYYATLPESIPPSTPPRI